MDELSRASEVVGPVRGMRVRWPWALLFLAIVWVILLRIPLILNVESHLDSDLAVDGLTLLEATQGNWRWHYPATPDMGIFPMFLSLPQALVWGANPFSLVSGGTVGYAALVVAVFLLAWKTFSPSAAAWALIPLTFASTGAIWLSGRITGGHLLTAVWHAVAFILLHGCLATGGWKRIIVLGLWCGLGISLDVLFVLTLVGLLPTAITGWWESGRSRRALLQSLLFIAALAFGLLPKEIGQWVDPHNAYGGQLAVVRDPEILAEHTAILTLKCIPRLISGHQLPSYQTDPDSKKLAVPMVSSRIPVTTPTAVIATWLGLLLFVWLGLLLFLMSLGAIVAFAFGRGTPARRGVCRGLLISSMAVVAAFLVNRNIFDSDNYRYLVTLLVPWPLGFGALMDGWARRGGIGRAGAIAAGLLFASAFTLDSARWYQSLGWIDDRGWPIRRPVADPVLTWLDGHHEVTHIIGNYWDAYRLSFLTQGRVKGVAYPEFPQRFPEWSRGLPGGRPTTLIVKGTPIDHQYYVRALREGGAVIHKAPGSAIVSWPLPKEATSKGLPSR